MPKDAKGNFHLNNQRAAMSDKMGALGKAMGKGPEPPKDGAMHGEQPEGDHSAIYEHLQAMHNEHGGAHSHVHTHEGGDHHTIHHISHDGELSGPHEHEDTESMVDHMRELHGGGQTAEDPAPMEGMHAGY